MLEASHRAFPKHLVAVLCSLPLRCSSRCSAGAVLAAFLSCVPGEPERHIPPPLLAAASCKHGGASPELLSPPLDIPKSLYELHRVPKPCRPNLGWVGLSALSGVERVERVERRRVVSPAPLPASTSRSFSLRIWRKKRKNNGQKSCVRAGQTGVNPPSKWIPGCRCARGVASPLPLHNASLGGAAQKEMVKLLIMALKENMLHLLWIAVQN